MSKNRNLSTLAPANTGNFAVSTNASITGTLNTADVNIAGNLIVTGTTVSINVATLDVKDLNITVAKGAATNAAANGSGITVDPSNAQFFYTSSDDRWNVNKALNTTNTVTIGTSTYFAANGNVGIGLNSPNRKLDVAGIVRSYDAGTNQRFFEASNANGTLEIGVIPSGTCYLGSITNNSLMFYTNVTERMRIDTNGNVGIDTNSPSRKFHVENGTALFRAGAGIAGRIDIESNAQTGNSITIGQGFNTGTDNIAFFYNRANAALIFGTSNTERMRITAAGNLLLGTTTDIQQLSMARSTSIGWVNSAGNGSDQIIFADNSSNLSFYTQNAERVRITSAGNVGIGTTSASQKLTVNGSIITTANDQGVYVGGSLSTDFGIRQQSDQLVFNWKNSIWIGMSSDNIWSFNNGGGISIGGSHYRTSDFTYYAKGNPSLIGYASTATVSDVSLYAGARIWAREFNAHSDARLKDIQGNLGVQEAKRFIDLIEPKKYKWKSEGENGSVHIGLIAQDVAKAGFFGMLATYDNNNLKEEEYDGVMQPAGKQMLLDYNQIQPILMVLVKDLYSEIEMLKARVEQLEIKA